MGVGSGFGSLGELWLGLAMSSKPGRLEVVPLRLESWRGPSPSSPGVRASAAWGWADLLVPGEGLVRGEGSDGGDRRGPITACC